MLSEFWSDIRYRLRAVFRRRAVERELDDEVAFHLERETEKLVATGLPRSEAYRQARLAFGGVDRIKEESRDTRGISWLQVLGQDLRYAVRGLRNSPGFTVAVVGTLALGIGANAAMFGIVDRLLFRTPAFLDAPSRVHRVYLETQHRGQSITNSSIPYTRYLDFQRWTSSLERIGAVFSVRLAVGTGEDAREMPVLAMSASVWDFFDGPPVLGRYFRAAEDVPPEGAPVAVLSHGLWQSRYGGRPDLLETQLQIGALSYTIIGVAPPGFDGPHDGTPPALFIPITSYAGTTADRTGYYQGYNWDWMELLVRRKPGISAQAAAAELTGAFERSYEAARTRSPTMTSIEIARPRAVLAPIQPERGPNQSAVSKVARWVSGVALIVLIIACANVANLLLARAAGRRREIGLRLALGVSRARLASQLLTESLLLAALGGLAGFGVARLGGTVLARLFLPDLGGASSVTDWRTVGFASLATLLAGLATGLAPILQTRQAGVADALTLGARSGTYRRSRTRDALLVTQGALSVVLLVGAGLFLRSLDHVRSLRLGYDVDQVMFVNARLRGVSLDDAQGADLKRRLHQVALTAIPEVTNAALTASVPFWMGRSRSLFVEGVDSVERLGRFSLNAVSPEYFATMGTRLLRGRGISREDRADAPYVMVVSEQMAAALWPGQDPIGRCVRVRFETEPCTTVIGVAEDIKESQISSDAERQYYLSAEQFGPQQTSLFVRVGGKATDHLEAVRARLQQEMPGASYVTVMPFRDIVGPQLRSWELGATMFLVFGGLAVLLAGIGLYSVIAYHVVQRRRELGVRIALGASTGRMLRLVVSEGVRFAALGVAIGAVMALAAGRWVGPLLFEQSPRDPVVFGGVALLLLAVAAAASAIPAHRATRLDPNTVLRAE